MFQEHLAFDPHSAICAENQLCKGPHFHIQYSLLIFPLLLILVLLEYRRGGFVLVTVGVTQTSKNAVTSRDQNPPAFISNLPQDLWRRFSGQIARCLVAEGVVPPEHSYTPCWLVWLVGLEYHHASWLQILPSCTRGRGRLNLSPHQVTWEGDVDILHFSSILRMLSWANDGVFSIPPWIVHLLPQVYSA